MTGLLLLGLLPFAALGIALGHLLSVDSLGPVIGGATALLAFLGGVWFPLGDGFMGDIGRALPSYWLVQAGHIGIGGQGWSATGWAVMTAWTVGADRARGAGLPARHREAVAPSATISRMRWLGDEPLADRPTLEKRAHPRRRRARRAVPRRADLGPRGRVARRRAMRVALGVGVALFVAIYLSVLPPARWLSRRGPAPSSARSRCCPRSRSSCSPPARRRRSRRCSST